MTPRRWLAIVVTVILPGSPAWGQLQWDADVGTAGAQGGSGDWVGTNFWLNGATNGPWVNGSDASFGGLAGIVTVNGPVAANALTFLTNGYTLTGTSPLTLGGGASISIPTNGVSATISATLAGTAGLTKSGAGTLILSGANTFTGNVAINGGAISVASTSNSGVAGSLGAGTSLSFNGGKLIYTESALASTNRSISLGLEGGTFEVTSFSTNLSLSGVVSGPGALIKTGSGQLGLSGPNTFTGDLVIRGGQVTVTDLTNSGVAGQIGAGSRIVLDGGILFPIGFSDSTNRPITLGAAGGVLGVGGTTEFSGAISGSGGLQKIGTGILILSGVNSFDGDVFVGNSMLRVANGNAIPDTAGVNFNNGLNPVLDLANSNETIGSLGAPTGGSLSGGAVTLGTGTLTTGVNNRSTTFTGAISGAGGGGLTKVGTGTLTLTGLSSFTGPVAILGGAISVNDVADNGIDSRLGAGSSLTLDGARLIVTASANDSTNRNITINAAGGTVENAVQNTSLALNGVISGAGGLTKTGPGSVQLLGNNSFAGPLVITQGSVSVNSLANSGVSSAIGAGSSIQLSASALFYSGFGSFSTNRPVIITNGGTLGPGNGTIEFSGPISGTGGVAVTGPGVLVLSGTNSYSGPTSTVNSIIRVQNGSAIPDASAVSLGINASAGLDLANSNETIGSLSGGGLGVGGVTLGSGMLTVGANNTSTSYAGAVSGSGGLVKVGTGTLTLTGASAFTGPVTLNAGVISTPDVANSGVASPLGAGSALVFDGGALLFTGAANDSSNRSLTLGAGGGTITVPTFGPALTLSGVISGPGAFTTSGEGFVELTATNTFTGPVVVTEGALRVTNIANAGSNSALGAGSSLTLGDGTTFLFGGGGSASTNRAITLGGETFFSPGNGILEFGGAITGSGGFDKGGSGVLLLSGSNTFTGNVSASAGTLRIAGGNAIPDNAPVSLFQFNSTSLDVNDSSERIGSLSGGGAAGGNVTLGTGTLTIGANNNSTTYDGAISGVGGRIVKVGTGTLTLSRESSFTGPLTVERGAISTPAIADSGVNSPIGAGSFVALGASGEPGPGTLIFTSLDDGETNRAFGLSGPGGVLSVTNALSTLTLTGNITGNGGITKSGPGVLFVSIAPMYTGPTVVNGGRMVLHGGIDAPGAGVTVNAGAELHTRGNVSRAIAGTGTIVASGGLIIGDSGSTAGFAFGGSFQVGTNLVVLADADVAQLGTNTTLDSGGRLNSFNGIALSAGSTLSVNAGVSGSISGNFRSNGTVNGPTSPGQTLTFNNNVNGAGNYTGSVSFLGGFAPGNDGPANVSLGSLVFAALSTLSLEIGGVNPAQSDRLTLTGTGQLDGTLNVTLTGGFQPAEGQSFTLISGGSLTGGFDVVNLPSLNPGLAWSFTQSINNLTLQVVPEPSVAALALMSGALVLAKRRRPVSHLIRR